MRELLIATGNPMKFEEIAHALSGTPFKLLSLKDVGLDFEVEEPGETLEGNAIIKAFTYGKRSGKLTLADDTGIEVDALDGRPGVKSARYASTAPERNQKLLEEMKDVPEGKRGARFRGVLAVYDPERGDKIRVAEDFFRGEILQESRGERQFGYDPLFYIPEIGKTYAELSLEEKNAVSHRGKALAKMREILLNEFV